MAFIKRVDSARDRRNPVSSLPGMKISSNYFWFTSSVIIYFLVLTVLLIALNLVSAEAHRARRSALINKIKLRFGTQGSPQKYQVIIIICHCYIHSTALLLFPVWSIRTRRITTKTWRSWRRSTQSATSRERRTNRSGNIPSPPSTTRPILTKCVSLYRIIVNEKHIFDFKKCWLLR